MTEVGEESSGVQDIETEKNVGLFLSEQLDKKGFYEGFVYIRGQWYDIVKENFGWLFKFVLWCIRYLKVQFLYNCQALVQVPNPLSQQAPNPNPKVRPSLKSPKTQFFGLGLTQ